MGGTSTVYVPLFPNESVTVHFTSYELVIAMLPPPKVYPVPEVTEETPVVHEDAVCSLYSIFLTERELLPTAEYEKTAVEWMYVPSMLACAPLELLRYEVRDDTTGLEYARKFAETVEDAVRPRLSVTTKV